LLSCWDDRGLTIKQWIYQGTREKQSVSAFLGINGLLTSKFYGIFLIASFDTEWMHMLYHKSIGKTRWFDEVEK